MASICEMQKAYYLLKGCGFARIYTGGGCTAWARFFSSVSVMITQDASADLEPAYMQEIGISVGAWCDETENQLYWQTCHDYAELPRLLLEAFAAAIDGGSANV